MVYLATDSMEAKAQFERAYRDFGTTVEGAADGFVEASHADHRAIGRPGRATSEARIGQMGQRRQSAPIGIDDIDVAARDGPAPWGWRKQALTRLGGYPADAALLCGQVQCAGLRRRSARSSNWPLTCAPASLVVWYTPREWACFSETQGG
jgi:hypothetical protein